MVDVKDECGELTSVFESTAIVGKQGTSPQLPPLQFSRLVLLACCCYLYTSNLVNQNTSQVSSVFQCQCPVD